MAPTPSLKVNQAHLRLHYNDANKPNPSLNPNTSAKETPHPQQHPVEVIARIRDYPDWKEKPTLVLNVNSNNHSIRVRADFGYQDFSLDRVSFSEDQDLNLL
ncbi:kinesin-like protein kin-10a [Quercus suber]|uniref:Kinesin-like protein kin-10a n=1 Tax=Quercus suber TaxID=58331 RepID=A0AAW0JKB6_QUESU